MNTNEVLELASDYANAKATWYVESLYGTSKSYTAEKEREMEAAHTALREALADQPAPVQEPDYAWPTVADYEKDVGFEVNQAFKMAWNMARTTNNFLNQLEKL